MKQLWKEFFTQNTLKVAENLIWKIIQIGEEKALITELEAYTWKDDPASHAFCWLTKRNFPMFEEGWKTYVYLIYGMYHCLNITTDKKDIPWAILIRWVKLEDGTLLDGPWKLTRYFWITKEHNNLDITKPDSFIKVFDKNKKFKIKTTPRIWIKKALDKHWRFVIDE